MSKYNVDQIQIGLTHATYAKVRALRRGELNTFNKVLNKLVDEHNQLHAIFAVQELSDVLEKGNAQGANLSERERVPVTSEETHIG